MEDFSFRSRGCQGPPGLWRRRRLPPGRAVAASSSPWRKASSRENCRWGSNPETALPARDIRRAQLRPIRLIVAGLPAGVSDLLNEGVETFLRRADRFDLHAASVTEVERSFTETFASADMTLTPQLAGTVRKPPAATRSRPTDGCYLWQEAEKRSRRHGCCRGQPGRCWPPPKCAYSHPSSTFNCIRTRPGFPAGNGRRPGCVSHNPHPRTDWCATECRR